MQIVLYKSEVWNWEMSEKNQDLQKTTNSRKEYIGAEFWEISEEMWVSNIRAVKLG